MFENISVKNALKLAYEGKAILFDIREEKEYKSGHLPMARLVSKETLKKELENDLSVKKILYCDYGNQSMRLAKELSEAGYQNIASIVGGYYAYEGFVEAERNSFWTMEWKSMGH